MTTSHYSNQDCANPTPAPCPRICTNPLKPRNSTLKTARQAGSQPPGSALAFSTSVERPLQIGPCCAKRTQFRPSTIRPNYLSKQDLWTILAKRPDAKRTQTNPIAPLLRTVSRPPRAGPRHESARYRGRMGPFRLRSRPAISVDSAPIWRLE